MKDLIGCEVEMFVDGLSQGLPARFKCIIRDEKDGVVHVEDKDGKEYRIPKPRIGMHSVTSDKNKVSKDKGMELWVYTCKHPMMDEDVKFLSVKEVNNTKQLPPACRQFFTTINKDMVNELDIVKIGNFFQLPTEIQCAFANGMVALPSELVKLKTKGKKGQK